MSEYDHDAIRDAELIDVTRTTAAKIAGEISASTVDRMEYRDDMDQYAVDLEVDQGFFALTSGRDSYAIVGVVGRGNPDTVRVWVVEKRH